MRDGVSVSEDKRSRTLNIAVSVGLGAWVLLSTAQAARGAWGFTTDDAFITLRYARSLANGSGITWNIGEPPVEGYSNFSFVLLGAAAMKIGLDPVLLLKWTGVLGLLAAMCTSYMLARQWVGPALAWLPAQFLTIQRGAVGWSVSGLETGFYLLVSLAAVTLTAASIRRPSSDKCVSFAACFAVVAALTRPEGIVVGACCLGSLAIADSRAAARFALLVGAPFVAYSMFRFVYFGHVLPNGVRCKMGFDADPWNLVREFLLGAWPLLAIGAMYPPRKLGARHVLLWSIIVSHVFVFRRVDPVLGGFNRYFLLAELVVGVLAVASVGHWLSSSKHHRPALEVLCALVSTWIMAAPRAAAADAAHGWANWYGARSAARTSLGAYLRDSLPANGTYAQGDAGLVAYLAPQRMIDTLCLNSAKMVELGPSSMAFIDWLFAQKPGVIVVGSLNADLSGAYKQFGVEQRILARGEFKRDYHLAGTWDAEGIWYFAFRRNDASDEP